MGGSGAAEQAVNVPDEVGDIQLATTTMGVRCWLMLPRPLVDEGMRWPWRDGDVAVGVNCCPEGRGAGVAVSCCCDEMHEGVCCPVAGAAARLLGWWCIVIDEDDDVEGMRCCVRSDDVVEADEMDGRDITTRNTEYDQQRDAEKGCVWKPKKVARLKM